jgi:4'-phosphopantetheinyl transferase
MMAIPPDVEIMICRLDDDRDIPLAAALQWLAPEERDRANRLRYHEDRARFIRGRGFLRHSLAQCLGGHPRALAICEGPGGKPCITGADLEFNLSHSGGLAALAISASHVVGIDIELLAPPVARVRNLDALIDACFRPDEAMAIRTAVSPQRSFLQFWTAKEARMKLTGEGMALAARSIALAHESGRPFSYIAPAKPEAGLHLLELCGAVGALAVARRAPIH